MVTLRSTALLGAAAVALVACSAILGIRPPTERPFEHRAHVSEGIHCLECHRGVDRDDDDPASHFPTTRTCTGCHETPHDRRDCGACHGSEDARARATVAAQHLRFSHDQHRRETGADCVRCHVAIVEESSELRPAMATCFGCHTHEDEWRVRDCAGCHVDIASEGEPPESHLVHSGDFLREHGARAATARDLCASCHSERSCAECHGANVPALPSRLRFDRPTTSGFHAAGFASRHSDEARADPGSCATCHGERQCRACHEDRGVAAFGERPAASPHPPGWLGTSRADNGHGRAARLDPASCASCHGGEGEMLCVGCHAVGAPGGSPHPHGFSSTLDRGRDLPCRMCHGATR